MPPKSLTPPSRGDSRRREFPPGVQLFDRPDPREVSTEWTAKASVLKSSGFEREAKLITDLLNHFEAALAPYTFWVSESDAQVRSGHTVPWLRAQFPAWEAEGNARKVGRARMYRAIVLPLSKASAQGALAGAAAGVNAAGAASEVAA